MILVFLMRLLEIDFTCDGDVVIVVVMAEEGLGDLDDDDDCTLGDTTDEVFCFCADDDDRRLA